MWFRVVVNDKAAKTTATQWQDFEEEAPAAQAPPAC